MLTLYYPATYRTAISPKKLTAVKGIKSKNKKLGKY